MTFKCFNAVSQPCVHVKLLQPSSNQFFVQIRSSGQRGRRAETQFAGRCVRKANREQGRPLRRGLYVYGEETPGACIKAAPARVTHYAWSVAAHEPIAVWHGREHGPMAGRDGVHLAPRRSAHEHVLLLHVGSIIDDRRLKGAKRGLEQDKIMVFGDVAHHRFELLPLCHLAVVNVDLQQAGGKVMDGSGSGSSPITSIYEIDEVRLHNFRIWHADSSESGFWLNVNFELKEKTYLHLITQRPDFMTSMTKCHRITISHRSHR